MPGLDPGIYDGNGRHAFSWMAGSSPAMTNEGVVLVLLVNAA
jgi:hypothetical protein